MKKKIKEFLVYIFCFKKNIFKEPIIRRILCLHDVKDRSLFEEKILFLRSQFKFVTLEEIIYSNDNNLLSLTFDDGYKNWMYNVLPVLEKYKIPATFFVCSVFLGLKGNELKKFLKKNLKRTQYLEPLSIDDLREIAKNPLFEVGGHTVSHINMGINDYEVLKKEVLKDKLKLENITGKKIKFFAYPFGTPFHISDTAKKVVKEAGYHYAFTLIPGNVNKNNYFYILRNGILLEEDNKYILCCLNGAYDKIYKFRMKLLSILNF